MSDNINRLIEKSRIDHDRADRLCEELQIAEDKNRQMTLPYIYRWNRQDRKGQPCEVLARGTMNSCLVRFSDGYTMITSRNAIKKNKDQQ